MSKINIEQCIYSKKFALLSNHHSLYLCHTFVYTLHVELIMTDTIMVFYFPDNIVVVHFSNSDWVCKSFKTKSGKTAQP